MNSSPLIEFREIEKRFGAVHASRSLCFSVKPGSIHGIVGENGAGKSTAMKMLFGMETPDSGQILVGGKPVQFKTPLDAMHAGIGMVHQHFMLAGPHSALDHLLLSETQRGILLDREAAQNRYSELARKYGFAIDLSKKVEDLPVGVQQRLEILKVLALNPQILIFDEPTAVLTPQETREFFDRLRALRDEGRTILIITHKLKEVMALTDEVTIFRQGAVVARRATAQTDVHELAELMIGRKEKPLQRQTSATGDVVLSLKKVAFQNGPQSFGPVDLEVRSGQIIGVAGVEGNGQDILVRLLAEGQETWRQASGEGHLLGCDLKTCENSELRKAGAAFFPEDRLRFGVIENWSASENFLLGLQNTTAFRHGLRIDREKLNTQVQQALNSYGVEPKNPDLALGRFSGGNQQKFVVARELSTQPKFILAAQPTRGVDLGAGAFIHQRLEEAKEKGSGILLISSELDELFALSDVIVVLEGGRIVARFERADFDESKIGQAMAGLAVTS